MAAALWEQQALGHALLQLWIKRRQQQVAWQDHPPQHQAAATKQTLQD